MKKLLIMKIYYIIGNNKIAYSEVYTGSLRKWIKL